MPHRPGHQTGHATLDAFTWREYLGILRSEFGGWIGLAERLQDRDETVSSDVDSVVRGLRRLANAGQRPGGKYGDLLLRECGLPASISMWGKLMGQYHSRFADLPVGLRRQQLLRWDRPPVSETPAAVWIHIGLASVAHREQDLAACAHRLGLAADVRRPEAAAVVEFQLLEARLASDSGDRVAEKLALDRAQDALQGELNGDDRVCYTARLLDQRAHLTAWGWQDDSGRLVAARALYEEIPDEGPPFVAFRRDLGLAWCAWRMGESSDALELCRHAEAHAGDGGLVRLRVMALNLRSRILPEGFERSVARSRAQRMARSLDDMDLQSRLASGLSSTPSTP